MHILLLGLLIVFLTLDGVPMKFILAVGLLAVLTACGSVPTTPHEAVGGDHGGHTASTGASHGRGATSGGMGRGTGGRGASSGAARR